MRYRLLVSILIFSIMVSGCLSASVHSKVDGANKLDKYKLVINTSSVLYSVVTEQVKKQGYSSIKDKFMSHINNRKDIRNKISYNEEWNGDSVSIIFKAHDIRIPSNGTLRVYSDGDYLVYEDSIYEGSTPVSDNPLSKLALSSITLHYYLEMPGEVVNSTATSVEGNKAEWHLTGSNVFDTHIYAKCKKPFIPGFGLLVACTAIATAIALSYKLRR